MQCHGPQACLLSVPSLVPAAVQVRAFLGGWLQTFAAQGAVLCLQKALASRHEGGSMGRNGTGRGVVG